MPPPGFIYPTVLKALWHGRVIPLGKMVIRNGGRWFDCIIKSELIRDTIWFPIMWLLSNTFINKAKMLAWKDGENMKIYFPSSFKSCCYFPTQGIILELKISWKLTFSLHPALCFLIWYSTDYLTWSQWSNPVREGSSSHPDLTFEGDI